jgi:hypothetical protein
MIRHWQASRFQSPKVILFMTRYSVLTPRKKVYQVCISETDTADAAAHLLNGGRIIVLGPAWPHLYSPFDHKIGHHRRYTKGSLKILHLDGLQVETAFYLDSVGYLASLANKTILKQSMPTTRQIIVWDRFMVPVSRVLDPLIFWIFGRSVVTVWSKRQ